MKIKSHVAPKSDVGGSRSINRVAKAQYSIRKHIAFWSLTFDGQEACFDHEQGAYYVAYLLLNPPEEPIHGMALEIKSLAYFGQLIRSSAKPKS